MVFEKCHGNLSMTFFKRHNARHRSMSRGKSANTMTLNNAIKIPFHDIETYANLIQFDIVITMLSCDNQHLHEKENKLDSDSQRRKTKALESMVIR